MNWHEILSLVITALVGVVLPPLGVMFLNWIKKQKWVQKLHLEDFFGAMVPQVVQWVEYWAEQYAKEHNGEKPPSAAKRDKFVELLKKEMPTNVKMTDDEIAMRAEAELMKLKNGLLK
jgi:hypothetical protein